ncbi:hypothetical protein O9K51_11333 [Purpureocillium lavendulum]|uniref:Glycosyl hydrolase family 95 catalytic domain-containing protein n=1 Tax=Purpureocillium lavendulum TaxID=1247861 RepID=A0AB34FA59_9HYPO|nr:hypothetical protein O9K51_11333 [Purpureocillium lavendulum]
MSMTYSQLKEAHITEYSVLYSRVDLTFGSVASTSLYVDRRLEDLRTGTDDADLFTLFFQYGRYLLLASSRPGTLPVNLQGIWNDDLDPIWLCQYVINLNVQMCYWPSELCNLGECHTALFDFIARLQG